MVLLPAFQLSEVADRADPHSIERTIKQGKRHPGLTYWYRFVSEIEEGQGYNYNLFPVVLDRKSVPWAFGMLFILSKLEAQTRPVMATFKTHAGDLGAFKEWLDSQDSPKDLLFHFPKPKLRRTTYRYKHFLESQVKAGELDNKVADRRINIIISFYRWLISNNYFSPEYPPWEEMKGQLSYSGMDGQQRSTNVITTDLSISTPKAGENFDGTIQDGGRLRPLTGKEQDWLIEAAEAKGNSEGLLLQLFMLGTGARIGSACTLRVRHFSNPSPSYSMGLTGESEVYRLKAGPGTGINTKGNKSGTFQVPRVLYELLHTYALSKRAELRRNRYVKKHGEHPDIYLFITQQGNPYYFANEDSQRFNPDLNRRHEKNGQTIRQFIKEQAIPYIRKKYDKNFYYKIHDLRASFGMNVTEDLTKQVEEGKISLHKALLIVKDLMWHTSLSMTERYLNYRVKIGAFYKAIDGYGKHLQQWTNRAMKGLSIDE